MHKTVATQNQSTTQETTPDVSRERAVETGIDREQKLDGEARLRSPQAFYAEATKRPDVREILKRLAES